MPRPTTPGGAEVELRYIWAGQHVENVLHFSKPTDWDAIDLALLAEDVSTWAQADYIPLQTNQCSLVEVLATDLSDPAGPSVPKTTGLPVPGVDTSGSVPNNVTVAVREGTAGRGRSFRGRTYFIGLNKPQISDSTLLPIVVTAIKDAFESLMLYSFTVSDTQWCVLSEISGGAPRANGIMTPIVSISVDPTTDSQRRRLPGRGQ